LAVATALVTAGTGWLGLQLVPSLATEVFAQGAARLAGLLTGAPVNRVAEGWMLAGAFQPVVVSAACSATDFYLIVATLLSWQLVRQGRRPSASLGRALGFGLLPAIGVNALRVVVVTQAHRWLIPALPPAYGHFLHMLTGVAVFLPSLIALNLYLESHGRSRAAGRSGKPI
jgi:exosortase/archaeosortase family protein